MIQSMKLALALGAFLKTREVELWFSGPCGEEGEGDKGQCPPKLGTLDDTPEQS